MPSAPASFTDENLCCLAVARAGQPQPRTRHQRRLVAGLRSPRRDPGTNFDNYEAAFRFGKMGFDLMEKRGPLRFKAAVYFCFAQMVNCWTKHFRSSIELQRRAFEVAQQTGNFQTASYTRNATDHAAARGRRSAPRGASAPPRTGSPSRGERSSAWSRTSLTTQLRLIRQLRGSTPASRVVRRRRTSTRARSSGAWRTIRAWRSRRLVLDPQAAGALLRARLRRRPRGRREGGDLPLDGAVVSRGRRVPLLRGPRARGGPRRRAGSNGAPTICGRSPSTTGSCRSGPGAAPRTSRTGRRSSPPSSRGSTAIARRPRACTKHAIRSARESGFVHNEAIAYETAARIYRGRGLVLIADTYLREARDRYLRWGADGKARDLERRNPQLVEPRPPSATATVALQAEQLDLFAVVKASQTISGEMVRDSCCARSCTSSSSKGGARRALVLLARKGRIEIAAEASSEELPPPSETGLGPQMPESLLKYVQRTAGARAPRRRGRRRGPVLRRPVPGARPSPLGAVPADPPAGGGRRAPLSRERPRPRRVHPRAPPGARAAGGAGRHLAGKRAPARARARRSRGGGSGRAPRPPPRRGDRGHDDDPRLRRGLRGAHPGMRSRLRRLGDHRPPGGDQTVRLAGAHRDPEKEPLLRELAERYPAGAGSHAPATTVLDERRAASPLRRRRRGRARPRRRRASRRADRRGSAPAASSSCRSSRATPRWAP